MVAPTQSTAPVSMDMAAGSTIAATLQGLISPGSTVYAGSTAVASSTTAMETDGASSDSVQTFQMSAAATTQLTVPPPIAILAPATQQQQQQGLLGPASAASQGEATALTASSRPQQAVCQLVQPSPQGLVAGQEGVASLQGVMTPAGTAVYAASGAQMITTETAAAVQPQVYFREDFAVTVNVCPLRGSFSPCRRFELVRIAPLSLHTCWLDGGLQEPT